MAQAVNSSVIEEFSLKAHGISGLAVEGIEKEECLEFEFIKETPSLQPEEFVFFSVNAGFEPVQEGDASIKVIVNGVQAKELKPEDFRKNWARVL
ncbi:hypothetical protein HZB89_02240, partial [archaeon]|nr:hypothetical protein [archaeon]